MHKGKTALPFLTGKPKTSATDFTDLRGLVQKIRENQCQFVAKNLRTLRTLRKARSSRPKRESRKTKTMVPSIFVSMVPFVFNWFL